MANNVINTRIQLKVDTLTNWQTNNPVLLDGEIAIAKIDIVDPANKHLQPAMIKVGDGTSTFNQLDWVSAKAADVYEWAKASTKPEYNFEELKNIPAFITPDELENYYTKDEINTKLSSVYKYKGTKDYYFLLPTNPEIGDVYNIKYASGENYEAKPALYSNYKIQEKQDLNGFQIYSMDFLDKPSFMNKETLTVDIFDSLEVSFSRSGFSVPILDFCPDPITSCAFWDSGLLFIYVIKTEAPFNEMSIDGYDTKYDEIYDYITNPSSGVQQNAPLQFNYEKEYSPKEPYIVNAGDNVAWTGTEWDILAGTFEIDLSNYVTNDNVVNSVNGKKGDITLKAQDLYNGFTVDENGIQYSGNSTYDFSINDGFTFKSINTLTPSIVVDYRGFAVTCDDPAGAADIIVKQNNYIDVTNLELGTYYTTHKLTEKANTKDLATIATSGDIYDISNADAVKTSAGTDDTGEKYIVFNCGSSTTVI